MTNFELIQKLAQPASSKIILLVLDGLGGLPNPDTGRTELETATTPNLDHLATEGICGLADPVRRGITPGSGPGHLALFGYDPIRFNIGRGVLETIGIDFNLESGDIAARGNFSTINKDGLVIDRRAGRISTEQCAKLCQMLDGMTVANVRALVRPVKDHRFVVVFRGEGLDAAVTDSDPQQIRVLPKTITALKPEAARMADIGNQFVAQAKKALADQHPANMILLRGFSRSPQFPTIEEIYRLRSAAIAVYPMYRGLARLVGMEILDTGASIEDEFNILKQNYASYDFFFIHIKGTDSAGEDGNFDRKVSVIEEVDKALSCLTDINPDVLVITGDHSTPARLKAHSWHAVPVLLHSKWCRPDGVTEFSELACIGGGLGRFLATEIMPLAMAHALRLTKFGA
ncbi:MAG: 2,3-bisphosphoglycerate-independent phosphoglycerate mutase [Dehalococcoidales bacterium]|nr:2,3-bisphosphoglycerate-independent phosphoglycerate mutase [Dehalococcoidales bacterium]